MMLAVILFIGVPLANAKVTTEGASPGMRQKESLAEKFDVGEKFGSVLPSFVAHRPSSEVAGDHADEEYVVLADTESERRLSDDGIFISALLLLRSRF